MSTGVRLARPFLAWRSLSSFVRLLLLAMVGLGGPVVGGATLESLEVTSDPEDEWYVAGDDITVRATFDEAVEIRHNPDLKLQINIGGTQRRAALDADAPARRFTFTYRVQDGDNDTDGISIDAGGFTGGIFWDQDDDVEVNVATTTLATLAGHKVDAVAPTVAAAPVVISDPGAYRAGHRVEFEITFDEDVSVSGNPELILSIGRNSATPPPALSRRATLVRTSPTQLTFRYVVQAGDFDDDGIRIQADALQGGVIEDLRGNPARRELTATTYTDRQVDTLEPEVVGVELTSAPARGDTYGEGEIIEVEVTFDEVVYVSPPPAAPRMYLGIGIPRPWHYAEYVTGSGTSKLTFRYTVQAEDEDDDGISIGPNALVGGDIEDEAGNNYAAVDRRIDPVREQPNHKVNGGFVNPTVTRVTIRSSPPLGQSGFYRLGDVIEVEVDFNVPVYVAEPREGGDDEELRLVLGIGQHSRYAVFAAGNGTTTLIFRYTVQAGDLDEDGISIGPLDVGGLPSLVGARLVDGEGNAVNRRFSALPADRSHKVDAVRPAATGVAVTSQPGEDGRYGRGERILVAVTLNEAVHVVQTADDVLVLLLQIGENTRRARFFAGSGTNQLMFRYTVRTSDRDDDGLTVGPDALVGAILEDEAGNDWAVADRRLPPLRPARGNRVAGDRGDDGAPVVTAVRIRPPAGTYTLNERIEIDVTFSEVVHVQGAPTLALVVGGVVRAATLLNGSGTSTLRFGYTVQAGDEDLDGVSIGPDALADGTIVDGAGNEAIRDLEPLGAQSDYKIDAKPPEIVLEEPEILSRQNVYGLGDSIRILLRYTEPVYVTSTATNRLRLEISIGELSRQADYVTGSGSREIEFGYIVQVGDRDDDGISIGPDALSGGIIEDSAGNDWGVPNRRILPLPERGSPRVDAGVAGHQRPSVRSVEITSTPGTYLTGDAIDVAVTFGVRPDRGRVTDATVHVSGQPTLELQIGTESRQAALVEGSGTETLTFRYVVQAGDYDADGISIGAGPASLSGGTIRDASGNDADRGFEGLEADRRHTVNVVPTTIGVAIVSEPAADGNYRGGERVEVEIRFSRQVHIGGQPTLELQIGTASRQAALVDGSGTETLTFRYVVQAGDYDADGISIGAGPASLSGGTIRDASGNDADRGFEGLEADDRHRVNAVPTIMRVAIVSEPAANGNYRGGERVEVEIGFSRQVHVSGQPTLELQIGTESRQAALVDGSGTETLTFRYVVQAGDYDEDGISIGAGPATLSGGTIRDASGNDADRGFEGLEADRRHKVNAIRPTITDVAIVSDPVADDTYRRGERVEVEIRFSRQVHVSGQPTLELQIGTESRQASLVDGSGTETLTFRYIVQAGDHDADGISIGAGPASLSGGTIRDASGNDADRGFEGLEADDRHKVNATRPTITDVAIMSDPVADGTYRRGERVEVEIRFSRQVHVSGRPTLELQIGTESRQALLVDGSGTETLTFRYVVQAGDYDEDGISIGAGPASLSGGTIRDASGNDADRGFERLGADIGHKVNAVPTITRVAIMSDPVADGTYRRGERVEVEIGFSRQVHVSGRPTLELQIGTASRQAALVDGSGTETLTFRYVVQAGDYDEDGISIGAGPATLSGGTISDASGNDADRGFEGIEADERHKVNAIRPTITRVAIMSDPVADDTYRRGERIDVEIRFSREVHVSGQPTLELQIGTASRQASLVDGSGTKTLTFGYVVQAGDHDADGISIGAGPASLSGGTIRDAGGNDADRGFEGLGADRNERHKVNAIRPTITRVTIVSTPAANNAYREGERIDVEIDYSDDVRVIDASGSLVLELTIGENKVKAALVAPRTDARKLVFRYTVRSGDYDADGISIGADALQDGRIVDDVGDEVDRTFDPLPNQSSHMVRAEVVLQIPLNLTVGGAPAVLNVYNDILIPRDIRHYRGGYRDPVSDDRNVATARVSNVYRLVITPVAEGTANIVVVAQDAAIALGFVVTVTANAAEVAVLEHALAAMGRGILASAANTIGTRLESVRRQPSAMGGRRIRVLPSAGGGTGQQAHALDAEAGRWGSVVACAPVTPCGANWGTAYGSGAATDAPFDGSDAWQSPRSRGMGRGGSFEMPLIGVNRGTSWALWGAGDFQTFEGEPESARYDGDVSAAYLGVDARGENWLAGAAVGRVQAQADYQFTVGDRTSRGNLETKLTVLSPYVQWPLGERGKMWALAGVGVGEATIKREGRPSPVEPTDLTMRMGLAGLRTEIAEAGNFRFAVRGELGSVQLETKKGETAVHGLAVNAQRARVGVEASFPMVSPTGAEFTPFADIGGRFDGGDGQTGGGIEVAAGVRASSPLVRFEAKARTLALHGADGYAETGASATVIVEPGEQGRGLRLSLAPRWGGADDAMDVFWRQDAGNGLRAFNREMERGWGVASRVDYGVAVAGRRGAAASVRPFGEVDLVDDDNRRMRVGMTYQLDSMDRPLRFELSSERVEQPAGTEHRFLLSAEGRF